VLVLILVLVLLSVSVALHLQHSSAEESRSLLLVELASFREAFGP
jgi:hypothetical protein